MKICKNGQGQGCVSYTAGHCQLDQQDQKVGCIYQHEVDVVTALKTLAKGYRIIADKEGDK